MKLVTLVSGILLGGVLHSGQTTLHNYRQDGWQIDIRKDTFSGLVTCDVEKRGLWAPMIAVLPEAIEFRFGNHVDTSEALYRVDSLPASSTRDLQSSLIQVGAFWRAEQLDSSTGGVVRLPLSQVADAKVIRIRLRPNLAPRTFRLESLWPIISFARAQGCRL